MIKALRRTRTRTAPISWLVFAGVYISTTVAVTLASLNESTLLSPAGIFALLLAPMAIMSVLIGGFAIGIPWVLGLTDADPDGYSDTWAYAVGAVMAAVNACFYLWLAARYRQRRRQGPA